MLANTRNLALTNAQVHTRVNTQERFSTCARTGDDVQHAAHVRLDRENAKPYLDLHIACWAPVLHFPSLPPPSHHLPPHPDPDSDSCVIRDTAPYPPSPPQTTDGWSECFLFIDAGEREIEHRWSSASGQLTGQSTSGHVSQSRNRRTKVGRRSHLTLHMSSYGNTCLEKKKLRLVKCVNISCVTTLLSQQKSFTWKVFLLQQLDSQDKSHPGSNLK